MTGNASSVDGVDVDGMRGYLADQPVRLALCFGSRNRGDADEASDVDVTLWFDDELDRSERFRRRNRIDADLQAYATSRVDVSDVEALPAAVGRRAVREGIVLVGDEKLRDRLAGRFQSDDDSERRRQVLDCLASGDA